MPNWTTNSTTFTGNADTINTIYSYFDFDNNLFDFDKITPIPKVLYAIASPVHIITDEEFKNKYNALPETKEEIEEFLNSYTHDKENNTKHEIGLKNITNTMSDVLYKNYDTDNWYDWSYIHWGVKDVGINASIDYKSTTKLIVTYDTPWNTPNGIFEILQARFSELNIVNMSCSDSLHDEMAVTWRNDQN